MWRKTNREDSLHSILWKIEKDAYESVQSIREGIKEGKYGRVKLFLFDNIGTLPGILFGGLGRMTGDPWSWILVPPIANIIMGGGGMPSAYGPAVRRGCNGYVKYGIGAALPYPDKIYFAMQEQLPKIIEAAQTLVDKL